MLLAFGAGCFDSVGPSASPGNQLNISKPPKSGTSAACWSWSRSEEICDVRTAVALVPTSSSADNMFLQSHPSSLAASGRSKLPFAGVSGPDLEDFGSLSSGNSLQTPKSILVKLCCDVRPGGPGDSCKLRLDLQSTSTLGHASLRT